MKGSTMTVYASILALLIGLTLGVIFADDIVSLFSGDPDNIYTLENGKYSYPIGAESDTILVPVDFPPDSLGQSIVFTIDPARTGPLFFAAGSGSGFADQGGRHDATFAPTIALIDGELVVEYRELLNTHGVETTCKVDANGGGTCTLVPMGDHWEVER